jgi:hypothetical protein
LNFKSDIDPEDGNALCWGKWEWHNLMEEFLVYEGIISAVKMLWKNLKEDDHSENLGIDIMIILK